MAETITIDVTSQGYDIDIVLDGTVIVDLSILEDYATIEYVDDTFIPLTQEPLYALKAPDINVQSGTSYTLQQSDNNKIIEMNSSFAKEVTVPQGLTGFQCTVVNTGSGSLDFLAASGVTLRSKDSNLALDSQYSAATIYRTASNEYIIFGDLTA